MSAARRLPVRACCAVPFCTRSAITAATTPHCVKRDWKRCPAAWWPSCRSTRRWRSRCGSDTCHSPGSSSGWRKRLATRSSAWMSRTRKSSAPQFSRNQRCGLLRMGRGARVVGTVCCQEVFAAREADASRTLRSSYYRDVLEPVMAASSEDSPTTRSSPSSRRTFAASHRH